MYADPTEDARPSGMNSRKERTFPSSELAASGECATERDLVGVLEVAADRQPAREPRHADPVAQPLGQVRGRRLAGHVRIRREHDFLDPARLDAAQQLGEPKVLGLDAVE